MPPIPLSSPPSMSFPLHPPIQLFLLPATFAPPYKYPSTSRSTSSLRSSSKPSFFPTSFPYSIPHQNPNQEPTPTRNQNQDQEVEEDDDEEEDDRVLGNCLVFEEGAFEDDIAHIRARSAPTAPAPESLVPEKWKEIVEEINLTKKEKRKIAHQLEFGSKLERRKKSPAKDEEEYIAYRELKLSQLKPVVLDDPKEFLSPVGGDSLPEPPPEGRVAPRNPKSGLAKRSLEDISKFFSSGRYVPGEMDDDDKKPRSQRKLFTQEEKVLLNKRIPNLVEATSSRWLPLHTLAASGEFYLLDTLLKHNIDINAVDKDGLAAIHKAILCKKQAIINFLLRNSANPFIHDQDGATLIHYAVQTASSQTIKILVLYNVDINLADHDGWTPLHLAVQIQRTDIVRLLLIKGADRNLKNRDGLTPLDLCFYLGHDMRTYELIKLLKGLPMPKPVH